MKKNVYLIMLAIFLLLSLNLIAQDVKNITSKDVSVLLSVEVYSGDDSFITLSWDFNESAENYEVYRRVANSNNPWQLLTFRSIPPERTYFTDSSALKHIEYEYRVNRIGRANLRLQVDGEFQPVPVTYIGFGYAVAGIEINNLSKKQGIVLLIDESIKDALTDEISRLIFTLKKEGWNVTTIYVERSTEFDGNAVMNLKNQLTDYYYSDPNFEAIFILGRVPVPYSGNIAPDGHSPDHLGAWPADVYYSDFTSFYSDNLVNNPNASRQLNKNIIGDGKFDQNVAFANVQLGRVDFYNLPLYQEQEVPLNEVQLLRNYLNKNYAYRSGQFNVNRRGLIDDNFSAFSYPEAFASSGWRNAGSLFGKDNVSAGKWFTTLTTDDYMFAYGCGAGSYTSTAGVGKSSDFAEKPVNAIFTMLFGSYFGDWDTPNNIMRMNLASAPSVLTCSWSARPHWFIHHLAMGYTMGHASRISHNNTDAYYPNAYQTQPGGQFQVVGFSQRSVHNTLLGDPSLTLYMNNVPEVQNLSVVETFKNQVTLNWTAPQDCSECLYAIYKTTTEDGYYELVTPNPISETTFIDNTDYLGDIYYAVSAVKLHTSNTGSFYMPSHRVFQTIVTTSIIENSIGQSRLTVSPNPATNQANFTISLNNPADINLAIYDLHGNKIYEIINTSAVEGEHNISWNLKDTADRKIPTGVYFIKLSAGIDVITEKFVIYN